MNDIPEVTNVSTQQTKDYIDENEIDETLSIPEIDELISKIETLRTTYRQLFIQFPKDNMFS